MNASEGDDMNDSFVCASSSLSESSGEREDTKVAGTITAEEANVRVAAPGWFTGAAAALMSGGVLIGREGRLRMEAVEGRRICEALSRLVFLSGTLYRMNSSLGIVVKDGVMQLFVHCSVTSEG